MKFWPFKRKKRHDTVTLINDDGWLTPMPANTLLDTPLRQKLLSILWQKVSMSQDLFNKLYRQPIERYAELVQNLPASESHHHAHLGGMLDHGLEVISFAANSLEARVPFGDLDFVDYVMSVNPEKKMNKYNKGKYLLRKAFEGLDYLPDSILYREKAAFSDAVGHSMVDYLKEYAEEKYTDEDLKNAVDKYPYRTPFTKESLLYRDIFEKFYPNKAEWIKDFWMPNKEWEGCDVDDPSARVLKNYGDSGK